MGIIIDAHNERIGRSDFPTPSFCFSTWARHIGTARYRTILAVEPTSGLGFYVEISTSGVIEVYRGDGGFLGSSGATTIPANTWFRIGVTGTFNSTYNVYYSVGLAALSTITILDNLPNTSGPQFRIGSNQLITSERWDNSFRSMRIDAAVRTSAEIDFITRYSHLPVLSPWGLYPLANAALRHHDYSGNGRALSDIGGAAPTNSTTEPEGLAAGLPMFQFQRRVVASAPTVSPVLFGGML